MSLVKGFDALSDVIKGVPCERLRIIVVSSIDYVFKRPVLEHIVNDQEVVILEFESLDEVDIVGTSDFSQDD